MGRLETKRSMREWGEGGGLEGVGIVVRGGRLERYLMVRMGSGLRFCCGVWGSPLERGSQRIRLGIE